MSKKKSQSPESAAENHEQQAAQMDADALKSKLNSLEGELEKESSAQIEALKKQAEESKAKADEHWEQLLRKEAELQNLNKRYETEITKARKFAIERFAQELLAVVDSFEQAKSVQAKDEASQALKEGMELTHKVLEDAMKKHGIEVMDPHGESFDPQFHEAISMQESAEMAPNKVLMVVQKGFLVHERVLRPARVVVAKAITEKAQEEK